MKRNISLLAAAGIAASTLAIAQAPTTNPDAASSPHQRDATKAGNAAETPAPTSADPSAASSPHQHEATQGAAGSKDTKMASAASPADFVKKAAQVGMTEVELGKIALNKSQDANVRKFAERMVQDHGKNNAELATLAKAKNLDVPKSLDSEHQAMVQQLSGKSGAAFDSAYAQHMAMDHDKAVMLFESGSKTSDAELAGFAKKTLPTLKEHKQMAQNLKSETRSASAPGEKDKPRAE